MTPHPRPTRSSRRSVRTRTGALLASLLCAALVGTAAQATAASAPAQAAPRAATPESPWAGAGPSTVATVDWGDWTVYYPAEITRNTKRYPVVVWGNGTGVDDASTYAALLKQWASWGIVVVGADEPSAGSGDAMLAGLDELERRSTTAGSPFNQSVDLSNVAASGHSQGGAGAIKAGRDPRVDTVVAVQHGPTWGNPGPGSVRDLKGPLFMILGQNDWIVSPNAAWISSDYATSPVETVRATVKGVGHFAPATNPTGFKGATTAWLLAELEGDAAARALFAPSSLTLATSSTFTDVRRRN